MGKSELRESESEWIDSNIGYFRKIANSAHIARMQAVPEEMQSISEYLQDFTMGNLHFEQYITSSNQSFCMQTDIMKKKQRSY